MADTTRPSSPEVPPLSEARLEEIRKRAEAATPEPWWALETRIGWHHMTPPAHPSEAQANAKFIAHARSDIPALLAEVSRLRANDAKGRERSWGLSVILALIDDRELERITRKMDVANLDRLLAVVNGYGPDIKARDASLSLSEPETPAHD
jgi:hypothetical protein